MDESAPSELTLEEDILTQHIKKIAKAVLDLGYAVSAEDLKPINEETDLEKEL